MIVIVLNATRRYSNPRFLIQGVCYDKESGVLYVADADDDSIKKIEVRTGKIETVRCLESLSTPWDVCLGCSPQNKGGSFDTLFVAMAGKHQVSLRKS